MIAFWKNTTLKKKTVACLLFLFFAFFGIWSALPNLVEWALRGQSEDLGFSAVEVEVEQVDPWLSRFSGLQMKKDQNLSFGIEHAEIFYSPGSLAKGKIDAVSFDGGIA